MVSSRQQQRREEDRRLAKIDELIRAQQTKLDDLEKRLMSAPAVRQGDQLNTWELTRSGLGIIVSVATIMTLIISLAVSWATAKNQLERKLDRADFVKDSLTVSIALRDLTASLYRDANAQEQFRAVVLDRLREICDGVRRGCR